MSAFSNLKPHAGSLETSFEEMVCQIVRRTDAKKSNSWPRLHGVGGDGGVEAFWMRAAKEKVGVQAKYFERSRDVSWSQIESSFATAIKIHRSQAKTMCEHFGIGYADNHIFLSMHLCV